MMMVVVVVVEVEEEGLHRDSRHCVWASVGLAIRLRVKNLPGLQPGDVPEVRQRRRHIHQPQRPSAPPVTAPALPVSLGVPQQGGGAGGIAAARTGVRPPPRTRPRAG